MKNFFINKSYFLKKFSSFHLFLFFISSLIIASVTIGGLINFSKNNKLQAVGSSYYVDGASIGGTCNNSNSGTITSPWCTIIYAVSSNSPISAGDTIYVRAGTYTGTVDFYKSGTSGNPITLTAYQSETVNINAELRLDPNQIGGYIAENWTFSKLNITNPSRDGIHIANGNRTGTITVDNCNISNNKANGIMTGWASQNIGTLIVKNSTIQYNDNGHEDGNSGIEIYAYGTYIIQNNNISFNGDPARTSSVNKGITFYTGTNRCSNCIIENNIFQNNLETGMDFRGNNGIIRNNLFIGNGQLDTEAEEYGDDGLAIQGDSANNKIYNNIIASSGGYELSVFGNNNEYYNNTFYKDFNYTATQVPASHYYTAVMIWSGSGNTFRNNAIVNMLDISGRQYLIMVKEYDIALYTNSTWSNNLYYSSYSNSNYIKINSYTNLAALQATGQDANSLFDFPEFINGPGHDFHLAITSPAVDAGYNLAGTVTTDYDGVSRPQGLAYDLSAYEYVSSIPNPVLQSSSHPDENSWYNTAAVSLSLASGSGANHYHYLVNQNPTASLAEISAGAQDDDGTFTTNLASDATWYIHIVAHDANDNPSANYYTYKVHYDHTAPSNAVINFSDITNNSITVNISGATDAPAGLHATEPYYFENLTNSTNSGWQTGTAWVNGNLPSLTNYNYKVKVKDKAGNILEVTGGQSTISGETNSNTNTNSNSNSNNNFNSNTNTNTNPGPQPTSQEGRLVKLENGSAVYYLSEANHNRYTFPDEKVFYSWYYNFNEVETISSSELLSYPLIGNVTMRPGTHLVKIQANPKVYAVEPGGIIRWIVDEQTFYNLGYNFSLVVDVPEIFFDNYHEGDPINSASEHPLGVLVKYANNPAVYYWDGSNLRSFANEGAFWWNRFYWEYLLTISNNFQYLQGQAISNRETNLVLSW